MQRTAPSTPPAAPSSPPPALRWVLLALGVLVVKRVAYHAFYLAHDPFALATISDGQLYEEAARDIVAHLPLGSQPFYLQGLYAYVLAVPLALTDQLVAGLVLQLALVAISLVLFHRAATRLFGALAGGISTVVLLALPELAFYENKYLSVALGIACNIFALWAFVRCLDSRRSGACMLAGFAAGLSVLGRPNLVLALPFTACALWWLARADRRPTVRPLAVFTLGLVLALAPLALRNLAVTGHADVTPSHGGGIPFYIGNNPQANGRWNTAGGLISGQVYREQAELGRKLGIDAAPDGDLARAVGDELYRRGFAFIAEHPAGWLALTGKKLWLTLGNHPFVRDYDLNGEKELLGAWYHLGLPFGVLLGLGALGLFAVLRRAREFASERARWQALSLVLLGQLSAVLAANLLYFTSAQNRVPLAVPLALVAGPGCMAVWARLRAAIDTPWHAGALPLVCAVALAAQAFWPRLEGTGRPSSVHYYNLASVEEALGRKREASAHYARAVERNPRQPVFWLSYARMSRELGNLPEATRALDAMLALPGLDPVLHRAAQAERKRLQAAQRRREAH